MEQVDSDHRSCYMKEQPQQTLQGPLSCNRYKVAVIKDSVSYIYAATAKTIYTTGGRKICNSGAHGCSMHSAYIFNTDKKCNMKKIRNGCAR